MASSSSKATPVPMVARINVPFKKGNQSFAPGPPMEVKEARIWKSHVLITFSISNNIYALLVVVLFMGFVSPYI